MTRNEYRPSVPGDWFVDPVRLGIPGLRPADADSLDNPLAWQADLEDEGLIEETIERWRRQVRGGHSAA